ncbi:hypothetical protein M948_18885 [Virgibacillus sp. CM-4]|nr:hypothetical protein M948_18885 [Virgibacillus sp. CM-4]
MMEEVNMKRTIGILFIAVFVLFVHSPSYAQAQTSEIEEEILYSIIIDRYNNLNHDRDKQVQLDDPNAYHGGDLEGITAKLDSFEELDYTTLVLSPLMNNASGGYHGYWIEDFYSVEEQFGNMEDLHTLIEEAHKRDIKVIMEFVTNYVAESHPIIEDSDKTDWVDEDNQINTAWGEKAVRLNQRNAAVQQYLIDVANYWMSETDIDGFKLHAADQSSQEFITNLTRAIKAKNEDFYLLADVLHQHADTTSLQENNHIDAVDNYSLQEKMAKVFSKAGTPVSDLNQSLGTGNASQMIFIDDKTTERFTQALAENGRNALTTWKLALTYMYTLPGVPEIYQGTELPMYGTGLEEVQQLVQFNSGNPDLTEFHNRISSLRIQFPVLTHGDYQMVASKGAMTVFKRSYEGESMYIAINNDEESQSVSISDLPSGVELRGYLGDNTVREDEDGIYKLGLARETAEVYTVEEDNGLNWLFIGFVVGIFILFIIGVIVLSAKQKHRKTK